MRRLQDSESTPSALALRRMIPGDLDEVMAIEREAFQHPWSAELFARELRHEWSTVLVAERGAGDRPSIVGFVIFWLVHDEIHVLNIATGRHQRRGGVARTLMRECLAQGRSRGARLATLEVRRSNAAAIHLYERLGFRTVGVRPNYYAEEHEDALVMLLDL